MKGRYSIELHHVGRDYPTYVGEATYVSGPEHARRFATLAEVEDYARQLRPFLGLGEWITYRFHLD